MRDVEDDLVLDGDGRPFEINVLTMILLDKREKQHKLAYQFY
jgi:hypothetical protein